jgi:hypothetical protein
MSALLVAVVGAGGLALVAGPAGASPLTSEPAATPDVAFNVVGGAAATDGLVAGSTVTFNVSSSGAKQITNIETRLCIPNLTGYTTTNYNTGTGGNRCVRDIAPGGIVSTTLDADPGTAGIQNPTYWIPAAAQPPGTVLTANQTVTVGTGTVTWANSAGAGPFVLTAGPGNPIDMVVKVITNVGDTYFYKQQLTFLAAPVAPVLSVATGGNTQVTLDWNDVPGATNYDVCVNTAPATGLCGSPINVAASNTVVTGLANFTTYYFTVIAKNAAGNSPISNELSATPGPPGPTGLAALPGDSSVALSWNAVGGSPIGYRVTQFDADCSAPPAAVTYTTGVTPTFNVTGLTNGTTYCFTVAAQFAGGFSAESASVLSTPGGAVIYQTINAVRPAGTLVISQRCAGDVFSPFNPYLPDFQNGGPTGDFDPSNPDLTPPYEAQLTPATRCTVNLSGPRPSHLVSGLTTATQRTVQDANVATGDATVTSPTAAFSANDQGQLVSGTGIPAGTRILSVTSATEVELTANATATFDDAEFSVLGRTITRPGGVLAAADVNKSLQGTVVPGGAVITAHGTVGTADYFDLSQPANFAATAQDVRIWDSPATPARLITSGPGAGAYLRAIGKMNQVYVVDYRDADNGWTATGQVTKPFEACLGAPTGPANNQPDPAPNACVGGEESFPANNLGWEPKVRFAAGEATFVVTAGGLVVPVTGSLGTTAQTLASAPAGGGLGVARLDADLDMLIPVQNNAGTYQSTLELTIS